MTGAGGVLGAGRTRSAVALVSFAVVIGCSGGQPQETAPAPVDVVSRPAATPDVLEGEKLLASGQVKEAWVLFEEAIATNPQDARAWLDLGLVYEEVGDWSAAEKAYRRSTEVDGHFAEAFNNLGVLMRERGELDDAIAMLERATSLDPAFGPARFNLALAYEDDGQLDAAEREYLETTQLLANDPVPRINLALMYLDAGRAGDALDQLRVAKPRVEGDVLLSIGVGKRAAARGGA